MTEQSKSSKSNKQSIIEHTLHNMLQYLIEIGSQVQQFEEISYQQFEYRLIGWEAKAKCKYNNQINQCNV